MSFLLSFLLVFSISAQTVPVKIDASQAALRRHVEYLASDKLAGRRTGEPGATYAAGYIANMFAKFKLKPGARSKNGKPNYMQPFSYTPVVQNPHNPTEPATAAPGVKARDAYNVIGILEGTDKQLRQEAIVIGAHYDHLGLGGAGSLAANPDASGIHHGADDNASGTSAVIELAREFAKTKTNKRTLIFIAFSGEEEGLFGSKYYVNNPVFPLEKTVAMINLDMVGRVTNNKLTIGGMGTASEWKSLVEKKNINEAAIIPVAQTTPPHIKTSIPALNKFDLALNEDGVGPSDHASFYLKNIPVLFFFSGTHLDYHKPSDTADKINFEGLDRVRLFVRDLVRDIDQNPVRPTYTVAKSSGMGGGRGGFNISLGTIPSYADSSDGMVLDGVRDNSPAARAGLKAGDKVVRLAGKDIKNVMDYTAALGEMKPDVEYEIVVLRGGERLSLKIVPVKR